MTKVRTLWSSILGMSLLAGMAPKILAQSEPMVLAASTRPHVSDLMQQGAQQVAWLLATDDFRRQLKNAFGPTTFARGDVSMRVPISRLAGSSMRGARSLGVPDTVLLDLDRAAIDAKGLSGLVDGALQLRIYLPSGVSALPDDTSSLWVAVASRGRHGGPLTVTAYDAHGGIHALDPGIPPAFPVLVLETDGVKLMQAGVQLINSELERAGFRHSAERDGTSLDASSPELTVLSKIQLKEDQEPWISGDAEVLAIVSGIQSGKDKPNIVTVDMPWLDSDKTVYTPFQDMIYWDDFAFGAANVQLFEQDDNTNYRDLIKALLDAAEKALLAGAPEYSLIPKIGQSILAALPDHWLTNDNDYIDSYYLIERGRNYSDLKGAAGNATATFCSYVIGANQAGCHR